MKRQGRTWKVVKRDTHYYVDGLTHEFDDSGRDVLLLYRYPDGDVDSPYDKDKMHGALYDLFQTNDKLKTGDVFETPHGRFRCSGVHVVEA